MKMFSRLFKYVLPQWPRVIACVVSAIIVAALLSLSFVTIIPLLKVMMGGEGLHGWADRKICSRRYGVKFYVPERADFTDSDIAYHLLVTNIKRKSLAQTAGLQKIDRIIGVGDLLVEDGVNRIPSDKLVEALAFALEKTEITVQFRRLDENEISQVQILKLNAGPKPFYLDSIAKLLSYLPKEQTRENKTKAVVFIILGIGIITVIRCIAKFYQGYMAQKVVLIGINHLREDIFSHVMYMPMSYFANERPSDTVSRILSDTTVMGKAIKIMLGKALREPLNAMFMLTLCMFINWQLTVIFLCSIPFILGILSAFGRKMKRATTKSLVAGSQMLAKLHETMAGLKIVKVYNQQQYESSTFKTINDRLLKQSLKMSKVSAATNPVMEVLGMIAAGAALIVGVHWVTQGRMESEEFLLTLILFGAAAEAVRKTSDIWNKIQQANAASERVFAIADELVEFEEPDAVELAPIKNKIEFRDIVFTYPGADRPVLTGVNLTVTAGHNIAVVGPNGSGKTTLLNLLPRFYDLDSGSILIDGNDIHHSTLRSLRDQIGMVTQNVVTFNDTIAANIAYGKPDATDDEIINAAKRSYAHEFIAPLPNGYDTIIGEQGVGLSGGQLQRIIIARAILKNPPILIFDEATSQIDADSEAKIHKAIEEIMQHRTCFIIAHRFSTVIAADVIVVLDNGQIIAQGQHEQLIKTCMLYQSLYETQLLPSK